MVKGVKMSSFIYIASDFPLMERSNPHEKTVSVNEAIALGIKDIPDFMLEEDFDKDEPDALLLSDRQIHINIDGTIEDGNFDDDFEVWLTEKGYEMQTEKEHCAIFQWHKYTQGRAKKFIQYLREQLEKTLEIELWHIWMDGDVNHNIKVRKIAIDDLKPEDIEELENKEVWKEPCIDYCYLIVGGNLE